MHSSRRLRWRCVAASMLVCVGLVGCSAGGDREPPSTPGSSASAAPEGTGATGTPTPTRSDRYPKWKPVAGLSVPRDDFGTAVIGSEIWALGGMTGERGNRLLSIEVLDTTSGAWRTADVEMPVGIASFETVALGPRIYGFGGFDAESRATDFSAVLDTRDGRWRRLPPVPHPRYAHTVTEYDGKLYLIGGRDDDGTVAAVDVFDPRANTWTTLDTPMANARDSHDTVVTPQGLMVLGGWLDYEPTDLVDVFDPETDTWTEGPRLPGPISRAGVAYADGKVWTSYHETSYVLEDGEWDEANALPLSRHGLGYVQVGDALYAIAGCALDPLRDVRTVDRLELG